MNKEQAEEEYKVMEALWEAEKINKMHELLAQAKNKDKQGPIIYGFFVLLWLGLGFWKKNPFSDLSNNGIFLFLILSAYVIAMLETAHVRRRLNAVVRLVEEYTLVKPGK